MSLTIDASIFVSALRPVEANSATSQRFLTIVSSDESVDIACPMLVLIETAASLSRTTSDDSLGLAALDFVHATPRLTLLELNRARTESAARIAVSQRLRGADSVYVQTADETGSTLITWDAEMLARAPAVVGTMTPDQYMADLTEE